MRELSMYIYAVTVCCCRKTLKELGERGARENDKPKELPKLSKN